MKGEGVIMFISQPGYIETEEPQPPVMPPIPESRDSTDNFLLASSSACLVFMANLAAALGLDLMCLASSLAWPVLSPMSGRLLL